MDGVEYAERTSRILQRANLQISENAVNGLLVDYLLGSDSQAKRASRETLDDLIATHADRILFSQKPMLYVPRLRGVGEIKVGKVVQGQNAYDDFAINLEDLQHLGIFAATYSGKTTLIATILTQLMRLRVPVPWMAFDFKRDLRGLSRDYDIKVLRWNWLKINPLQPPPGVDLTQWMTFLADIMAHVFGWFHASENYLMQRNID